MLADAVQAVIEGMQEIIQGVESKELERSSIGVSTLKMFCRQLQIALKAGEGTGTIQQQTPGSVFVGPAGVGESLGNLLMPGMGITDPRVAEALKQDQLARQKRKSQVQEGVLPVQREVIGNPDDPTPTFAPVDPLTPIGAKTVLSGKVYVLHEDGRLHYSAEDTSKLSSR